MSTIHDQIQRYINGELSDDEIDRLWKNYLQQPIWFDYFITELTAKKVYHPASDHHQNRVEVLWEKITSSSDDHFYLNAG